PLGDTCDADLQCVGGVCRPRPDRTGDFCTGLGGCPPQTACIDPDLDGVRTCEPPAEQGGPCNPHDGGSGCLDDLECEPTQHTCTPLPRAGQPCSAGQCATDHACVANVCEALPGLGAPCLEFQCATGLACHPQNGTCITAPGLGQTCLAGSICAPGLQCNPFSRCDEPPPQVCLVPGGLGFCIYENDG